MVEIIVILADAVVSFWVGKIVERKQNRQFSLSARITALKSLIRTVSDSAQSYYTLQMNVRERQSATVLINSNMRRISNDLSRLGEIAPGADSSCLLAWKSFYREVTGHPFGSERFDPLGANDTRIEAIQLTEADLIGEIEKIEGKR